MMVTDTHCWDRSCLVCLRNDEEVSVARVDEVREKGPDEVREIEMAENQDVAGHSATMKTLACTLR